MAPEGEMRRRDALRCMRSTPVYRPRLLIGSNKFLDRRQDGPRDGAMTSWTSAAASPGPVGPAGRGAEARHAHPRCGKVSPAGPSGHRDRTPGAAKARVSGPCCRSVGNGFRRLGSRWMGTAIRSSATCRECDGGNQTRFMSQHLRQQSLSLWRGSCVHKS